MSLVGIAWDEKRLRLSCQPDPSRPACCLDELCDIDVPQTVVLSENDGKQRRVFVPELLMAFFDTKKSRPTAIENNLLQAALSEYFTKLIPFLEESVDVRVLLMEESIDHLAFVVPMGSDPSRIKEFKRIAESIAGFDVTVIAYVTACAALAMGRFISKRPYLLCEWTDELILSAAFSYDTLRHYSRIKPYYRLSGVGPLNWVGLIERALEAEHGLSCIKDDQGAQVVLKKRDIHNQIRKAIDAILSEEPSFLLDMKGMSVDRSESSQLHIELTHDRLREILSPVCLKVVNFIKSHLPALIKISEDVAVLCGPGFTLFSNEIEKILLDSEVMKPVFRKNDALIGLHACIKSKPMLPYDCGILLRQHGNTCGIGTLVLVRPTAVGQTRESEELKIPNLQQKSIDAAFYVRRFDMKNRDIRYEIMKSHIFAPSIDGDGFARIKVSMKVENREANGLTTVSIDLEDVVSHKKVSFQKLHLTGGTPMECPPLRHYGELKGMKLAGKIEDKRKTLNKEQNLSPYEWRRLLEEPVMRKKVTRKDYATQIMVTVVEDRLMFFGEHYPPLLDTFLDEKFIHTASPEDFQAAGRDLLFFAMHDLATTVSELNQEHGKAADWAAAHPFTQGGSTSDITVVNSFVNALSQDMAGNQREDDYMQQANRIKECYSLTCSDPHGLNVDWRVQD